MLDTLAIRADWPLLEQRPDGRVRLGEKSAVRVMFKAGRLTWAEASLPRLMSGHNGRLITNQAELDCSLRILAEHLSKFAKVPDLSCWQPWRMDLVWQFPFATRPLVWAHFPLKVPGIRKPTMFFGDGLAWTSSGSRFGIKFYNKCQKMRTAGDVLRVEVSLRGEQLAKRIGENRWDFNLLYQVFRRVMISIPPIQKPAGRGKWQEAVGAEPQEGQWRMLARLAHNSERTLRRWHQRISAAQLDAPFSWAEALPMGGPPPPVHVGSQ